MTPFNVTIFQVTPFNVTILREHGVTYGDSFWREVPAIKREQPFASSETFTSRVGQSRDKWFAEREFVSKYPTCTVKYEVS